MVQIKEEVCRTPSAQPAGSLFFSFEGEYRALVLGRGWCFIFDGEEFSVDLVSYLRLWHRDWLWEP